MEWDTFAMSVNDQPAVSRQFEAHGPFWGSKFASITGPAWQKNPVRSYLIMVVAIIAFCAVFGGLYMGVQSYIARDSGGSQFSAEIFDKVIRYGFVLLLLGGVGAYYRWSKRRKILIGVTSDGLTVNKRPGDVFSLSDAKLGVWGVSGGMTMGTALHLQCGPHRFVLGGRDHRIAAGTRLEAPDAGYGLPVDVDAWVSASDFDELLTVVGRRSGLDIRRPAQGDVTGAGDVTGVAGATAQPTRCLLFPNPLLIQQMGPFAFRKKQQLLQSASQPRLAIDVGKDAIWVKDPSSDALIGSAWLAQVTATPETYRYRYGSRSWLFAPSFDQIAGRLLEQAMAKSLSTSPVLVVCVPGLQPLIIGCRDSVGGLERRFSWRGKVRQRVNEPPEYAVSGADWLTLVEKLGLATYLEDRTNTVSG
jgi:hypothetical protein